MWIRSGAEDKERHEKVEPKAVDTPSPGPTVEAMNRCKGSRDREDVGRYVWLYWLQNIYRLLMKISYCWLVMMFVDFWWFTMAYRKTDLIREIIVMYVWSFDFMICLDVFRRQSGPIQNYAIAYMTY